MSSWKYYFTAGTFVLAIMAAAPAARAITIVSTFGDRDGFNGFYNPDTQTLPFRFDFFLVPDNDMAEPQEQDRDYFEENEGATYTHVFTLPPGFVITSAQYEIVTFDNASGAQGFTNQDGNIYLDGVELHRGANQPFFYDAVGEEYGGADLRFNDGAAELFTADIPASMFSLLADGTVVVHYLGLTEDNVGVDYSRITINGFVPEPSSLILLAAGAVGLMVCLRWPRR